MRIVSWPLSDVAPSAHGLQSLGGRRRLVMVVIAWCSPSGLLYRRLCAVRNAAAAACQFLDPGRWGRPTREGERHAVQDSERPASTPGGAAVRARTGDWRPARRSLGCRLGAGVSAGCDEGGLPSWHELVVQLDLEYLLERLQFVDFEHVKRVIVQFFLVEFIVIQHVDFVEFIIG